MLLMSFYADGHSMFDGAVFVYRRQTPDGTVQPTWQMRLKLPRLNGYVRKSCKTKNYEEACSFAREQYLLLHQKVKEGVDLKDWTFNQHWRDWFERQSRRGAWSEPRKDWHRKYFTRYFTSYFGNRPLNQITASEADGYWEWRIKFWQTEEGQKLIAYNPKRRGSKTKTTPNAKRVPSTKTLRMEQSALNQIFQDACTRRRMSYLKLKAPTLSRSDTRRPAFDDDEYSLLVESLEEWMGRQGRYSRDRPNVYQLLRRIQVVCYVGFLAETGIRVGEARRMRWEDISFADGRSVLLPPVVSSEPEFLHVRVRGKTGARNAVSTTDAWHWLGTWLAITPTTNPQDFVWQGQGKVGGTSIRSSDFNKTFQSFLRTIPYRGRVDGLLCDAEGQRRTVYSLRHTYATSRLLHGDLDPLTLARNMGTSVQHLQRHYSHVENIQNAKKLTADKRRDKASDETSRAIEHVIEDALRVRSSRRARCAG